MSKILKAAVTVLKSGKSVRVGSEVLGKGTAKALVAEYKKLSPKAKKTLAAATSVDQAVATAFTLRTASRGWEKYADYWASVESDAEEIAAGLKSGEYTDQSEAVAEAADRAMTYTNDARLCLVHTGNSDALFENEGSASFDSLSDVYTRCGYYAYEADLNENLSGMDTSADSDEDTTDEEE